MESRMMRGLPVIALETGKLMGKVQAIAVNNAEKKVAALILGEKVFLKSKSLAVVFDQLQSLGPDAITIAREADAMELASKPELENMIENSFLHQKAISEKGILIGNIEDFTFDPTSGSLHGLVVRNGRAASLSDKTGCLPLEAVNNFGKDFVICKEHSDKLLEAVPEAETTDFERQFARYKVKGKNLEELMPAAQARAREVGHSLELRAIEFSIGREAGFTLTAPDGRILIKKGEKITQEILDLARKENRLYQLLFSAGIGELLDGIEYTSAKLDEGSRQLVEAWEHYRRKRQEDRHNNRENREQAELYKNTQLSQSLFEEEADKFKDKKEESPVTVTSSGLAELEARMEERWSKWEEKLSRLIKSLENNNK